jgi:hypothetical protein
MTQAAPVNAARACANSFEDVACRLPTARGHPAADVEAEEPAAALDGQHDRRRDSLRLLPSLATFRYRTTIILHGPAGIERLSCLPHLFPLQPKHLVCFRQCFRHGQPAPYFAQHAPQHWPSQPDIGERVFAHRCPTLSPAEHAPEKSQARPAQAREQRVRGLPQPLPASRADCGPAPRGNTSVFRSKTPGPPRASSWRNPDRRPCSRNDADAPPGARQIPASFSRQLWAVIATRMLRQCPCRSSAQDIRRARPVGAPTSPGHIATSPHGSARYRNPAGKSVPADRPRA